VKGLDSWTPRRGLSIPCVSVLAPDGAVLEEDQRRLTRYLIQGGRGADVLFVMGTTGEWNRLDKTRRQRVIQVVVEEVRKQATRLEQAGDRAVEAWVGVTAPSVRETLENLELAIALGAQAAVLAPLAVRDAPDPVRFLQRDVSDFLDGQSRRIPVFLYDNPDIAAGSERRMRTRWVKQCSRLDFVRGIKVSASPRRLGHYTKAARQFRDVGPFAIYVGDALHIFDMMRPRSGVLGRLLEQWNRFLLHDLLPAGVVAGPANLLPREWQRAWRVACAGDQERMDETRRLLARFREACSMPGGRPTLACLKRGLLVIGVISSDAVAAGTRALSRDEAASFDAAFERLRAEIEATLPSAWCSDPADAAAR
jgi:dihydrodipicolinate synthase/N-acetylneuraminate lyase